MRDPGSCHPPRPCMVAVAVSAASGPALHRIASPRPCCRGGPRCSRPPPATPARCSAPYGHPVSLGRRADRLAGPGRHPAPARPAPGRPAQPRVCWAVAVLLAATVGPVALVRHAVLQPLLPAWAAIMLARPSPPARCRPSAASVAATSPTVGDALRDGGLAGGTPLAVAAHRRPQPGDTLDEAGRAAGRDRKPGGELLRRRGGAGPVVAGGGLPGIVFYKAVNTADSMIGHLTPRHRAFGWAAARLDDLLNLPASRLAAFWLVLRRRCAGAIAGAALRAVRRDAGRTAPPTPAGRRRRWPGRSASGWPGRAPTARRSRRRRLDGRRPGRRRPATTCAAPWRCIARPASMQVGRHRCCCGPSSAREPEQAVHVGTYVSPGAPPSASSAASIRLPRGSCPAVARRPWRA